MPLPYATVVAIIRALWILIILYWFLRGFTNKKTAQRESFATRFAYLTVPFLIGLAISFIPGIQQHLFAEILPTQLAGIGLTAAGIAFAIHARIILGTNWSGTVTLKQNHELIQTGPYRWVRHPIYTGLTLAIAGSFLALNPSPFGIACTALVALSFAIKLQAEEQLMLQQFPDQYPAYRQRVRTRFLPFVY
jgi:protein-S-isoprenylcysteine O-methyltransferase Ste14